MMKCDDVFEIVMNSARLLGTERLSIKDNNILSRILTEDITSDIDVPSRRFAVHAGGVCSNRKRNHRRHQVDLMRETEGFALSGLCLTVISSRTALRSLRRQP